MTRISGIRSAAEHGFTLMELVVVVVLVGLLAFTVIPRMAGPSIGLDAQAEQLAADIRYTQSLAMTRGDRYRINLAAASYQITDSSGANPQVHPGTSSTNPVLLKSANLSGYNPPLINNYLVFDGRGVPYAVYNSNTGMASNASITLTGGGASRIVVISSETGRVVLQ